MKRRATKASGPRLCGPLLALIALPFSGCQLAEPSDPTEFYVLASPSAASTAAAPGEPLAAIVGIERVRLPGYLSRSDFVVRDAGARVRLQSFQRWAEPLEQSLTRGLRQGLDAELPWARVIDEPWRRSIASDYTVRFDIEQFEPDLAEGVVLMRALVYVRAREAGEIIAIREIAHREPIGARASAASADRVPGNEAALAMSRCLPVLTTAAAEALNTHRR